MRRLEIFGIEPRMDFAAEVKVTRAIPYTVFLSLLVLLLVLLYITFKIIVASSTSGVQWALVQV